MKITLNKIESGEEEVIVNYWEMNSVVEEVIVAARGGDDKIWCTDEGTKRLVPVRSVLYIESVDRGTYVYTPEGVYKTPFSLQNLEIAYSGKGLFRCSKSLIINIYRISELRSEPGGRINAAMENGEHVIISRKYAKDLRRELRGEE